MLFTLQMFTEVYRVFTGKSECGDFKFMGIACYPHVHMLQGAPCDTDVFSMGVKFAVYCSEACRKKQR